MKQITLQTSLNSLKIPFRFNLWNYDINLKREKSSNKFYLLKLLLFEFSCQVWKLDKFWDSFKTFEVWVDSILRQIFFWGFWIFSFHCNLSCRIMSFNRSPWMFSGHNNFLPFRSTIFLFRNSSRNDSLSCDSCTREHILNGEFI